MIAEAIGRRLPWPLPALGTWLGGWAACAALRAAGIDDGIAAALGIAAGIVAARAVARTAWRFAIAALGFPLSLAATGIGGAGLVAAWWLVPLALLAVVYPVGAWRDAPLFPTPRGALAGLARVVPLVDGSLIVDAGCGAGDGLRELRREYPGVALRGIERSAVIAWIARRRMHGDAQIRIGDLYADDWSRADLVYAFQRPESMPRIAEKAARELKAGAWLASLEFAVEGCVPAAQLECPGGRMLFVYRMPASHISVSSDR